MPYLNIVFIFKAGRKRGMRRKQVHATWECIPFREDSLQTVLDNFSFQLTSQNCSLWPIRVLLENKHQRIDIYWVTSMELHRAIPMQIGGMNFQERNVASNISPPHPASFFLTIKHFFFLPCLFWDYSIKNFWKHSKNNVREWNQMLNCGADLECSKSQKKKCVGGRNC